MRSLIKNKKAQILAGLSLGMVVVASILVLLVIVGIFIFTSINKFAIIGGGMVALALIFGLRGEFNNTKAIFLSFVIVGGLVFIFASSNLQSVLSLSQIKEGSDGKVYWVFFASANKPGEGYQFTYSPGDYTKSDGTEVRPQKSLLLSIYPGKPQCIYQTQYVDNKWPQRDYWILKNPEKKIDVEIYDRNGNLKTLDGTTISSVNIPDTDGKGKVVVETQGLLSGKFSCPNYDNVAIWSDDKKPYYLNGFSDPTNGKALNTQFLNAFDSTPTFNGNQFVGSINFGYPTFTITADQEYFDSVEYIKPESANPKITGINAPSSIQAGGSSSIKLSVKNLNSGSATVNIKATAGLGSISPSSKNLQISPSVTNTYFDFKAPSSNKCGNVEFEVCSTDQFSSNNCDTDSVNICSVSDEEEPCGNGVCDSFESYTTCPSDCEQPSGGDDEQPISCAWYEQPYTKQEKDYGVLYWRAWLPGAEPKITETQSCRVSNLIWFIAIIGLFALLIVSLTLTKRPKRRKRK